MTTPSKKQEQKTFEQLGEEITQISQEIESMARNIFGTTPQTQHETWEDESHTEKPKDAERQAHR